MGCRCSDIRNCVNDISKINEIKDLFSNTELLNFSVTMELQSLAMKCMTTFSCINMADLISEEKKLNKDMIQLLPRMVTQCDEKIEQLRSQEREMVREDTHYHSEKHHHHRHHHD